MRKIPKTMGWGMLLVAVWFAVNLVLASRRSLSCDEWPKFEYMRLALKDALYMHLSEFAPYAPGEIVLGAASKHLFGWVLSNEVWTRLPALLFGAATVGLGLSLRLRFMILPLVFSVALTSFVTQFQAYAAMMFGGALAFKLIYENRTGAAGEKNVLLNGLAWFNLIFGHIYGICFVAFAQAFRGRWREVAAAVGGVAAILIWHFSIRRQFGPVHADYPPLLEIARQTGGTLTNPHKGSYLYLPLALAGLIFLSRRDARKFFGVLALLAATIVAPMLAARAGSYMFLPRQIVGGVVPMLALAALGYYGLASLIKRQSVRRVFVGVAWCFNIAASVLPWIAYVGGVAPFIDQPLHRLKTLTREIADTGATQVLWTETGTAASGAWYFDAIFGKEQRRPPVLYRSHNLNLQKDCWQRTGQPDFCVHLLTDLAFLYDGEHLLNTSADVRALLLSRDPVEFDAVVHSLQSFTGVRNIKVLRTW